MEKPFVLIIEDERDIAALFRHVMDLAGYRTEIAANGRLAVERLSSCLPDVVLLDLSLPGIPGTEVLSMMRADRKLKDVPVVVVTAFSELAENLAVEPDLVMLKPVSAAQLTGLVQRLAGKNRRKETAPFGSTPWDDMTGVYNRAFFVHRLDSALQNLKENGQSLFAVLTLSPDGLDAIRRQHGDAKAGEFLHALAAALKTCIRSTDTLARFEPDRFVILIEQSPGLQVPEMIARRIQHSLQGRPSEPGSASITCNIGILLCDQHFADVNQILQDAATAFNLAQAAGPGISLTFDYDAIHHPPK